MSKKQAVILAGGKGTRLKPYTVVLPKPLMPIGDYPILEVVIRQLVYYGFEQIILAVNHQAEIIQSFFGDGSKWNVDIQYSIEKQPLGTMGPLKLIDNLEDDFLVINGDTLTDMNFNHFFKFHCENHATFSIASTLRSDTLKYGMLTTENQVLTKFVEKPTLTHEVSMGIYMLSKKILNYIPDNAHFGFDNLMEKLLISKEAIHVYKHQGYWSDIGCPDDYAIAIDDFAELKSTFLKNE